MKLPADIEQSLPPEIDATACSAHCQLSKGIDGRFGQSELLVVGGQPVVLTRSSMFGSYDIVALAPDQPPVLVEEGWQHALVVTAADGERHELPVSSFDKERVVTVLEAVGAPPERAAEPTPAPAPEPEPEPEPEYAPAYEPEPEPDWAEPEHAPAAEPDWAETAPPAPGWDEYGAPDAGRDDDVEAELAALELRHTATEDWDGLLDALEEAAARDPALYIAATVRGARVASELLGDDTSACEWHERVVAADCDDRTRRVSLKSLQVLYLKAERWADLLRTLERLLAFATSVEDRVAIYARIAIIHEQVLNAPEMAAVAYQRIVELEPDNSEARAALLQIEGGERPVSQLPAPELGDDFAAFDADDLTSWEPVEASPGANASTIVWTVVIFIGVLVFAASAANC